MIPLWAGCAILLTVAIIAYGYRARRQSKFTKLRGPPRRSYLYGYTDILHSTFDQGPIFEEWSKEYGLVYQLPSPLAMTKVVVMDPKAIAHIFGNDTYGFRQTPLGRLNLSILVRRNIV